MVVSFIKRIFKVYRAVALKRLGRKPTWKRLQNEFEMKIDPADPLDQALYFGTYEPGMRKLLHLAIRPGETCLDIGAHKGYFALMMAHLVGSEGKVISVDADPRTIEYLQENRERNGFHHISSFHLALSDRPGVCEFMLNRQLGDSSRFPNETARTGVVSNISVPMRALDNLLDEEGFFVSVPPLSYIKIDAEGSEPYILKGMTRTLSTFEPILSMEINFASLKVAGVPPEEIQASLEAHGYSIYEIHWHWTALLKGVLELRPITLNSELIKTVDILAVKPDSPGWERIASLVKPS